MDPARPSQAVTPEQFGPYEVHERLGMGGMAQVHRAKKRGPAGFERTVALKRMLPHLTDDRGFVDSFVREAKVASMLAHPNIAQVYDFGRINGVFYIAMELVGGFDLRKLLRHAHRTNEAIPLPVVLSVLCELCEALDYAHSFVDESGAPLHIVHRDISPSNLIVSPMGHVKVIDFGIAKANSRQLHTETGSVKGKLGYMAPEVALGMAVLPVSDVFSAGVVAWELVTALPLFSARTDFETMRKLREEPVTPPSRHNPLCPPLLDQVILAALEREPEHRLQGARAFRTVLDQVAAQQRIQVNARGVGDWMREVGPPGEQVRASSSASVRVLPLPAGPETRVTQPSRPQLRRSHEDIALATEIWGEDGTQAVADSGEDFSMASFAGAGRPSSYAESLPGTPIGAQIPSLAGGGRVQVLPQHPSQLSMAHASLARPPSRSRAPIAILAGLAIVAGILGGVLYAKRSSSPPAPPVAATAAVATLEFAIVPPDSTIEVAGKPVTSGKAELAPGVYSIAVRRDGYTRWTTSLTLRAGDHQTINVALQPESEPEPVAVAPAPVVDAAVAVVAEAPEVPERVHRTHHAQSAPDVEPEAPKPEPVQEPAKVEPTPVEQPKVAPPVEARPKPTPVVAPSAVTKLSGDVPTLRSKSGDSSDILAKMCIDETGRVTSVSIKKSPPEIADDLQRALMTWRYKPYINRDRKASDVCFPLSIRVILKQ
jgi:serine/threonine-protein kinase